MAYFYVKNSLGTRTTGGGLTQQSGDFASLGAANVYATIEAAIDDGAGAGDVICVSNAHLYTHPSGDYYIDGPNPSVGASTPNDTLIIISVSDANCDQYSKATSAQIATNSGEVYINYRVLLIGVWVSAINYVASRYDGGATYYRDCTIEVTATGFGCIYRIDSAGADALFDRCDFRSPSSAFVAIIHNRGGRCKLIKCTTNCDGIIFQNAQSFDTGVIEAIGCDFSTCTGPIADIDTYKTFRVSLVGCILPDGIGEYMGAAYEPFVNNSYLKLVKCYEASTPEDAPFQYYYRDSDGRAESDKTIYRNESSPLGTQKISHKVRTRTSAYLDKGFKLTLPYRRMDLSTNSTIRVYLASTATLTDQDVIARVIYEDADNQEVLNIADNLTVFGLDSATELTADAGSTWKDSEGAADLTGYNEYYLDIDTSGDPGGDCVPIIELTFGKPSTTIYVDPVAEAA